MKFRVEKNIVQSSLSDDAVAVYVALKQRYKPSVTEYCISNYSLCHLLFGCSQGNPPRYVVKRIRSGLQELINEGVIDCIHSYSNCEHVVALRNLSTTNDDEGDEPYILIEDYEVNTIMNLSNVDRFKLLRYFIYLTGTFNSDIGVGFTSVQKMSDNIGISKDCIQNYNKLLQDNQLIYVYNPQQFYRFEDGVRCFNNTYGRYCDRDKVVDEGSKYCEMILQVTHSKALVKTNKQSQNRKASAMYRAFLNGKVYDTETLQWIYETLSNFNQEIKEQYGDQSKYLKDLSVFENYEFYQKGV